MGRVEHQLPKNRDFSLTRAPTPEIGRYSEYFQAIQQYYFGNLKLTNTVIIATLSPNNYLDSGNPPQFYLIPCGNTTDTSYVLFSHSHNFADR